MTAASESARPSGSRGLLDIRRHEYAAVAWSFAYFFCVLSSYYILRPIRESLAVGSGPDTIPYLFMGTFAATVVITPIFGWIVTRFPRRIFLPWSYLFFVLNILALWFLFSHFGEDHVWLGRAFFVWIGVFNLFVVSVFWSFMADIYTREQGRRLFGVIAAGGSIGALLGGILTSYYVVKIGLENLFPISAAVLSLAVLCIGRLRKWAVHEHREDAAGKADKSLGGGAFGGVTHVLGSRYFLGIAAASVIASLLGTALYMFAAQLVEAEIPGADERTRFFSNMNNAQNFIALFTQAFLVKQVVVRFGLNISLVLMPLLSIVGFAILALEPVLWVVAVLTVARRAVGFGFTKPSTDMLYSVVTPEEKYKAKNFIDLAVYRGGDLMGTWTVKLMSGLGMTWISVVLLPFAVVWAALALWLGNDYRRRAKALKQEGVS